MVQSQIGVKTKIKTKIALLAIGGFALLAAGLIVGAANYSSPCDRYGCVQMPPVKVLYPNGGEKIVTGKSAHIRWSIFGSEVSNKATDKAACSINLIKRNACAMGESCDLGQVFVDIVNNYQAGIGRENNYEWQVPKNLSGGQYRVRVSCDLGGIFYSDSSDGYFEIIKK